MATDRTALNQEIQALKAELQRIQTERTSSSASSASVASPARPSSPPPRPTNPAPEDPDADDAEELEFLLELDLANETSPDKRRELERKRAEIVKPAPKRPTRLSAESLAQRWDEIAKIQDDLARARAERDRALAENQELRRAAPATKQTESRRVEELGSQLQLIRKDLQIAQKRVEDLTEESSQRRREAEALRRQLEETARSAESDRTRVVALETALSRSREEAETARKETTRLQSECSRLQTDLTDARMLADKVRAAPAADESGERHRAELERLATERAAAEKSLREHIEHANQECQTASDRCRRLETEVAQLREELGRKKQAGGGDVELDKVVARLQDVQCDLNQANFDRFQAMTELDTFRARVADLEHMQTEYARMETELRNAKEKADRASKIEKDYLRLQIDLDMAQRAEQQARNELEAAKTKRE